MVKFDLMPLTKHAAIQKILELQSKKFDFNLNDPEGSSYDIGFQQGQIVLLLE